MTLTQRAILIALTALSACGDSDSKSAQPQEPDIGPTGGVFGADTEGGSCVPLTQALDSDYAPGEDDAWPACESDDGKFHPFNSSISAVARAEAFDQIGELLFDPDKDASPADFLAARKLYEEDEGISSRVVRRYDPHYDVPDGTDCSEESDVEAHPDYCAGPAKISPLVLEAFAKGNSAESPRWQAGRIEGGLLWFFNISTYKESFSCSEKIEDCDSSYGYYDGAGEDFALGRYIKAVDADAHDAATLGALAVHCWRDVDMAIPPGDVTLREQARTQLDRAVVKGSISVLLDRIAQAEQSTGDAQLLHWGFVSTYLHVLDSQLWRDGTAKAAIESAENAKTPADTDLAALKGALNGLASCGK